jgi:UDP-N-acetylmuramyl pentapeptide phosphotransferase/UDP-N-acetylglucosamine-1-phosphate transferase
VAFCLAVLAVPVADTVRVMLGRILKGNSPFRPDKTHLHHIFIKFGMSHAITSATIVGIDILIAVLWYFSYKVLGWSQEAQFYLVVFLGVVLVWGTYSVMRLIEKKNPALKEKMASASLAHTIEGREWWHVIQRWLDAPEILSERRALRRERILKERNQRKFVNERGGEKDKGQV